jgi:hypothetical protein
MVIGNPTSNDAAILRLAEKFSSLNAEFCKAYEDQPELVDQPDHATAVLERARYDALEALAALTPSTAAGVHLQATAAMTMARSQYGDLAWPAVQHILLRVAAFASDDPAAAQDVINRFAA